MRMRTKKWAKPELAVCPFYIKNPELLKGKWNSAYKKSAPMWLELGIGKGSFLAQVASANPDINFLGIDVSNDMLGLSKRNIESMYAQKNLPIDNVLITWQDIERIHLILEANLDGAKTQEDGKTICKGGAYGDIIDRIFINFCNPWFKPSQYKKRLTYPRQLEKYKTFLKDNAQIWFKTDDDELFEHSKRYFEQCGFTLKYATEDLHAEYHGEYGESYVTEHEKMYSQEGIKIKFLIAQKK